MLGHITFSSFTIIKSLKQHEWINFTSLSVVVLQSLQWWPTLCDPIPEHSRLLCPPLSLTVFSHSCRLDWCCYLTILFSATPFSFCLQSFPAPESFPMSQLFISGGQSIGASASAFVLPKNIQSWFPLGMTGLILQFKGLSWVFSNTTIWKHQFFGTQPFLGGQRSLVCYRMGSQSVGHNLATEQQ